MEENGLRVVVLGGTGGVGRQVCAGFAAAGHQVLAVARTGPVPAARHGFVALDVAGANPERIAGVLLGARADVVVNATGGWGRTEEVLARSHVGLVHNLIAALGLLPKPVRLVHIGSIHEYGPLPWGTRVSESWEPAPDTVYGKTKLAGSQEVLEACRTGIVDGTVLRVVNVYGPSTTAQSFLGSLVQRLKLAKPGEQVDVTVAKAARDYVDVRDAAEVVVRAAERPAPGRVINIGRGAALEMSHLVRSLVDAVGFPPDLVRMLVQEVDSKGGNWTAADIGLAGELFGWSPRFDVMDSLRDMWNSEESAVLAVS
ncbi:NAD-dependent epimerase/dehydratase family protein [Amycolatopsis sp. NPDC059090]